MSLPEIIVGAVGCLGLVAIGYFAGWADCERAHQQENAE